MGFKRLINKVNRKMRNLMGMYNSPDGVIILMYHRINDDLPEHQLVTRIADFNEQMEFLYDNHHIYDVISLKDLEKDRPKVFNRRIPRTKVIITLDDGYRDNYLNAFPILKKFKFPATVFLTMNMIDTDKKFDRYSNIVGRDMLSWDEVNEMLDSEITFGAHTLSHPHLPELNYEEQKREIQESELLLKKKIPVDKQLNTFCFPYGEYNEDTLKIMKELEYLYALSVRQGVNNAHTSFHELKRIEISGYDRIKSFEFKVLEKFLGQEDEGYHVNS